MEDKFILGCINGFPPSEAVVDYASWLTRALGKELKLFHTIDQQYHENESDLSGSIGFGAREEMLKEMVELEHQHNKVLQQKAKLILEAGKEQAAQRGIKEIDLCLRRGKLIENLMDLKDKTAVTVIGKYGKRHQNLKKEAVGHKVEAVVRTLKKPILIVSEEFTQPKSFCLAYDGSEGARKTLDFICQYKGSPDFSVHVVYVGEEDQEIKSSLEEAKKKLEECSFDTKVVTLKGEVAEALKAYINENDISLLAMGAFSHNWLHDFVMGSVTSKVIKALKKPLLLVR